MNDIQVAIAKTIRDITFNKTGREPIITEDTSVDALCVNTRWFDQNVGRIVGEIYAVMPNGWVRLIVNPEHTNWYGPPYQLVGSQLVAVEGFRQTPQTYPL